MEKKTVLIAGGTGLIGSKLSELLIAEGYTVRLLSRSPKGPGQFFWDPAQNKMDPAALEDVDAVINLAGEGIADKRWTKARKKALIESRVQSADLLFESIQKMSKRPETYLSASAIGIYGDSGETWMVESSAPANPNFLVECCRQWEHAADRMTELNLRVVKFRIGVVLALEGGALAEIVKPLRFGLGAYFGNGRAWWSWIHREDVCRAFIWALNTHGAEGVFNLCAGDPERGKALVKATAKAMKQPAVFLPAPAFVLQLIFGEMSAVILNSNRISAEKLHLTGFEFKWPNLNDALVDIFAPNKTSV